MAGVSLARLPVSRVRTKSCLMSGRSERGGPLYFYGVLAVAQPLMPHATAAWMVDNTALSFEQSSDFCGLHILEIQAIADDTTSTKLTGRAPVRAHEVTQEEIDKGAADPDYQLKMIKGPDQVRRTKGPRYTPVSKRQDKPDGIAWIIRNHPEITDGAIVVRVVPISSEIAPSVISG